jgi:hypothetical protein
MPWVIELETDLDQLCMQFLNFFNGSLAIFTFFSFLYVNMFFLSFYSRNFNKKRMATSFQEHGTPLTEPFSVKYDPRNNGRYRTQLRSDVTATKTC